MCYKGRPTTIFSACNDNDGEILYFCDPRVGRNCSKMHIEQEHLFLKKCYSAAIDQHNRHRQDTLKVERKKCTQNLGRNAQLPPYLGCIAWMHG